MIHSPIKLLSILILIAISACMAQPQSSTGYRISISAEETAEDTLYLGFYSKAKTYTSDTAYNKDNTFVFQRDSVRLEPGFFFLLNPQKQLVLDFVVGQNQHFSLKAPTFKEPEHITVQNDEENETFFEIVRTNKEYKTSAQPYIDILEDSTQTSEAQEKARETLQSIQEESQDLRKRILKDRPDHIMSKMIRINQNIELPPEPKRADGSTDPYFQLRYYHDHYFDHMPLSDSIYLRFPPVTDKDKKDEDDAPIDHVRARINSYLDKLHIQDPDTIIAAIDRIAELAAPNATMFTHAMWHCTTKYQNPTIMGMDKILVHVYDTYYATGRMDSWANDKLVAEIKKIADQRRLSLIGSKAPDLIMQDQNLQKRSLYKMENTYRVVYFFNPECGACAKETPKLLKSQQESAFDIGVFAVCADTSMSKMKKYIEKMKLHDWAVVSGPRSYVGNYQNFYDAFSTPVVMVIDRKNQIIAKKLPSERLNEFLKNHEAFLSRSSNSKDP